MQLRRFDDRQLDFMIAVSTCFIENKCNGEFQICLYRILVPNFAYELEKIVIKTNLVAPQCLNSTRLKRVKYI